MVPSTRLVAAIETARLLPLRLRIMRASEISTITVSPLSSMLSS